MIYLFNLKLVGNPSDLQRHGSYRELITQLGEKPKQLFFI
jgi:superfamily I DNA and/or RNA helicase